MKKWGKVIRGRQEKAPFESWPVRRHGVLPVLGLGMREVQPLRTEQDQGVAPGLRGDLWEESSHKEGGAAGSSCCARLGKSRLPPQCAKYRHFTLLTPLILRLGSRTLIGPAKPTRIPTAESEPPL
ncbi:unnamed protein product [Boreogadus saida]